MIRKANECATEKRPEMRGGTGTVEITNFVTKEELLEMVRSDKTAQQKQKSAAVAKQIAY